MSVAQPSEVPEWADGAGALIVEPELGQKQSGWAVGDKPPAQYVNWFWNLVYAWLLLFQALANGAQAWAHTQLFAPGEGNGITATGGTGGVGVEAIGGADEAGVKGTGTGTASGGKFYGGAGDGGAGGNGVDAFAGAGGIGGFFSATTGPALVLDPQATPTVGVVEGSIWYDSGDGTLKVKTATGTKTITMS